MAFGLKRKELNLWKEKVSKGEISFLTHYWYDPRFPESHSVTKVGCNNIKKLIQWGRKYHLNPDWIDHKEHYPHFDILGDRQLHILTAEGFQDHIERFNLNVHPKSYKGDNL